MNLINRQDELTYKKLLALRTVASLTFDLYIYRKALESLKDKSRSDEFKRFLLSPNIIRRLKECIDFSMRGYVDFAPTFDEQKSIMTAAEGLIGKYDNIEEAILSIEGEICRYRNTFYDICSLPIELGKLYSTNFDGIRGIYDARAEMNSLIEEAFRLTPFKYGSDEWKYCITKGQKWYFHYVFLGGHTIKDMQDTLLDEFIKTQITEESNSKYISGIVRQHLAHGATLNLETYTSLLEGAYKDFHPRKDETAPTRYNVLASLDKAGFYNTELIVEFINSSFAKLGDYESWNLDLMLYNVFASCVYACPLDRWLNHFVRLLLSIPEADVYMNRILAQAKLNFHVSITSIFEETYENIKTEIANGNSMQMKPINVDE